LDSGLSRSSLGVRGGVPSILDFEYGCDNAHGRLPAAVAAASAAIASAIIACSRSRFEFFVAVMVMVTMVMMMRMLMIMMMVGAVRMLARTRAVIVLFVVT